jgi:DNA polymerase V
MPQSLIGFGDADSFYASAEVVRRPWLAGVPVGVLGNQGACVIARNYEMKPTGVKVGMPVWEAKKLCPDGVYLKRDFHWYEAISRKMLAEVRANFSPRVEYSSIDEFFWEGHTAAKSSYQQTAEAVRGHIKKVVGVPMTVAFARTRTLAKLFADTAKPFGAVAVEDEGHETELLGRLPVTEIAGIASRRAARLEPYGVKTCLDFRKACGRTIKRILTASGHDLWLELNGERVTPIRPNRTPHKMISRGGSLAGQVSDPHTLYGWLVRNVERLIEELHYHEVRPETISLYVGYHNLESAGGSVRLTTPSDRFDVLMDAARIALRQAWRKGRAASSMHLVASNLVRPGSWQPSLFDAPDPRWEAVARVKAAINERFGRFTLRSGATLYSNRFYADPANKHDVCDVRGKFHF